MMEASNDDYLPPDSCDSEKKHKLKIPRENRLWASAKEEDSDSSISTQQATDSLVSFRSECSDSELSETTTTSHRKRKKEFSVILQTPQRNYAVSIRASNIKMFIDEVKTKVCSKCPGIEIGPLLLEAGNNIRLELEDVEFNFLKSNRTMTVIVDQLVQDQLVQNIVPPTVHKMDTGFHNGGVSHLSVNTRELKRLDSSELEINRDSTVETTQKIEYQKLKQHSLDLVTTVACHLVKIVMSHCYGTQDTCKRLHRMLQKRKVKKSSNMEVEDIKDYAKVHMRLRTDLDLEMFEPDHYWLTECKDVLTSLSKKDEKRYEELKEDMSNWEPSICLSVIIHAKDVYGNHIFKSKLVNFSTDESEYDFVTFAELAKKLRNNDCHSSSKADIINAYDEEILSLLDFLAHLKKFFDTNTFKTASEVADYAYMEIKQGYVDLFQKQVPHWDNIYRSLRELDHSSTCYMLITAPLQFDQLTDNQKKGLSSVPWCCVVDYDPDSSKQGFLIYFRNHQSQNISCESKTFLDMQNIECNRQYGDSVEKLTSGHKCFWFLPHGDTESETEERCPLYDKNLYNQKVRYPLNRVMRFILERCKLEKPPIVVFLCYNQYAFDGQHQPPFFHDNLKVLYESAVEIIGEESVIFLTNRVTPLGKISCFHIPLPVFCDHLYQSSNDLICDLPLLLPSIAGELQIEGGDIAWIKEDFEIVHKNIDGYELYDKAMSYERVKMSKEELNKKIVEDATIDFLRGNRISWIGLSYQIDIKREFLEDIKVKILEMRSREMPGETVGEVQRNTRIFELYHETGAGASTLARRVLWDLRAKFICLILHENFSYSADAVNRLTKLYEKCNRTILLLVDEDLQQYNTELLTYQIQVNSVPLILFRVIRTLQGASKLPRSKRSSFLFCHLDSTEVAKLKTKYEHYLPGKVVKGGRAFHGAKAFGLFGECVIAHDGHWKFCRNAPHSTEGVIQKRMDGDTVTVEIKWSDSIIEQCPVDTVKLKHQKDEMQTFMFYGIFYLVEEFQDRMNDHIQKKLGEVLKIEGGKQKLQFLAYISLLFAYNACYSLPQACFGGIKFDILEHVPFEAHDFISKNKNGSFRVVHTIVAEQIMHFYHKAYHRKLSDFVIDFLRTFIPNDESANQKLRQAVSTLLWTRRSTQDDEGSFLDGRKKRQDFSPLICELQTDDARRVLLEGTNIFYNCHSFGHLARFYAIEEKHFDEAKECMEKAVALAGEHAEGTIYNMYGDIYRYELKYILSVGNVSSEKWKYADELHALACEKYKLSSRSHHMLSHPCYGELKVRLDYLKCIRRYKFPGSRYDAKFMKYLLTDPTVLNSDGKCIELLEWLEDFALNGDGGKEIGSDDIVSIRKHQQTLYDIMGEKKREECIKITEELLKLPHYDVNHPAARRKYINLHLIRKDVKDLPEEKRLKMLWYLECNLNEEGYKGDTMKYWLRFASTLLSPHSDVNEVLKKLKEWDKHVLPSDVAFVKFYLYVLNFLAALECPPQSIQFDSLNSKFEKEEAACRRENSNEKTRHWTKKWLARNGNGIGCLQSGKVQFDCLKMFTGKIGNIERDSRKQSSISFKGFSVFFDLKDLKSANNARNGSKVQFGIAFTYRGIRAINISSVKTSMCKVHDLETIYYCETCEESICAFCTIKEHAEHKHYNAKKMTSKHRNELKDSSAPPMQDTISRSNSLSSEVTQINSPVNDQSANGYSSEVHENFCISATKSDSPKPVRKLVSINRKSPKATKSPLPGKSGQSLTQRKTSREKSSLSYAAVLSKHHPHEIPPDVGRSQKIPKLTLLKGSNVSLRPGLYSSPKKSHGDPLSGEGHATSDH
ncbi:uncharacterized protein [Dysidea avara]|uniref:uncharacterized protein isoform X2 n=1 Tax=Dysidea avara TaxID=196820 RepID=UPI003319ED4D